MLEAEKPRAVYLPRLPGTSRAGVDHRINASVSRWQKGYVKNRLARKCLERSIEFAEVFGKGISSQCSQCGAVGKRVLSFIRNKHGHHPHSQAHIAFVFPVFFRTVF